MMRLHATAAEGERNAPQRLARLLEALGLARRHLSAALASDENLTQQCLDRIASLHDDIGHLVIGVDPALRRSLWLRAQVRDAFVRAWDEVCGAPDAMVELVEGGVC
jgi:hypothetical protein